MEEKSGKNTRLNLRLGAVLSLVGVSGFVLWLVRPLLIRPGMPWGTDVYGHLARVWYLAKSLAEHGTLPQWFPYWYVGNTVTQYYPPLATYVMVPIQYLTNDISVTYRIVVVACLLVMALAVYKLARRWVTPPWAALGAAVYVSAPYTMRTVFSEGALPRTMAIALTPVIFYLVFALLEKRRRSTFAWLAFASTTLVLLHDQHAAVAMICLGIICVGTFIAEREKRLAAVQAILAMGIGIGLAGWWLLPALTHFDYPTVPNLSVFPQRLPLYSIHWSAFWPGVRSLSIEDIYIGLSLVGFAVLVAVLRRTLKNWLFLGTAVVAIALAFGTNNPVYRFLPMGSFLPERFLNVAVLLLVLLVVELGLVLQNVKWRALASTWGRAICFVLVVLVFVIDFAPYFHFPRMVQYPVAESAIAAIPVSAHDARLDVQGTPGGSEWSYLPMSLANMSLDYGWSIETTPHLATTVQHNVAISEDFPDFVLHDYVLWNVRTFIGGTGEAEMVTALESAGFNDVSHQNGLTILNSPEPSTPIMQLKANGIAIGRGAYNAALAFPYLSIGKSWYLEDYNLNYLSHFKLVYLYDFRYHDLYKFETMVRQLVARGTMVILDLTNVPEDTPFGVNTVYSKIPSSPAFAASTTNITVSDGFFQQPFSDWRGVTYDGLDGVLATVTDRQGETRPVFGYKNVPEGRVYFLGLNMVGHIVATHDAAATDYLNGIFGSAGVYQSISQPAFATTAQDFGAEAIRFSYDSSQSAMVLVSETWSPHWRAEIDGVPLTIYNHEDLMALSLPAGSHEVVICYGMTMVQWLGIALSLLFLCAFVALLVYFNRLPDIRQLAGKLGLESDE